MNGQVAPLSVTYGAGAATRASRAWDRLGSMRVADLAYLTGVGMLTVCVVLLRSDLSAAPGIGALLRAGEYASLLLMLL